MKLLHDLRRRRVLRFAGLYIVGAWIVIEVASVFFPAWGIPDTALRYLFVAAALLFPVAIAFSWVFDVTSDGIVRTRAARDGEEIDLPLQRADYLTLGALLLVGLFVVGGSLQRIAQQVSNDPVAFEARAAIENSVAVLPFTNLDSNPDTAYFSDGITEEILHRLSSLKALHVLGQTSSFAFRESSEGPAHISQVLGVQYLLHGSVRRDANLVRVTARLLDRKGLQVWSKSFDRQLESIFTIQSEIASTVATQIARKIIPLKEQPLARTTTNMEAYNQYLIGRAFFNARTPGWQAQAEAAFRQAISLDPGYAPPHSGLAAAITIGRDDAHANRPEALEAVRKSLDLDPGLAEAHATQGLMLMSDQNPDLEAATLSLRHALTLDPSLSIAYNWLSGVLSSRGLLEEYEDVQNEGHAIDPLNPPLTVNIADREYRRGKVDYAEQLTQRLLALPKPPSLAHWQLMRIYTETGRYDQAATIARTLITSYDQTPNATALSALAWTHLRLGMDAEAAYWVQRHIEFATNPVENFLFTTYSSVLAGDHTAVRNGLNSLLPILPPKYELRMPPFVVAAIGSSHIIAGDLEEAIRIYEARFDVDTLDALDQLEPPDAFTFMHYLAFAYQQSGRDDDAQRLLLNLEGRLSNKIFSTEWRNAPAFETRAVNDILRGDYDAGLSALKKAIDLGWNNYLAISHDEIWADALQRPDFQKLMEPVREELARQRSIVEQANAEHDFRAEFEARFSLDPL